MGQSLSALFSPAAPRRDRFGVYPADRSFANETFTEA
jgi:hypothetical protein